MIATFGPPEATCEVLVFREGLLSSVGHDLLLRVTTFEITVDTDRFAVSLRLDAGSLRVVGALRDGRPMPGALRPGDVREIEATIASTVLSAARFPEIRFASTEVLRAGDGYEVRGSLELVGKARPLVLAVRREADRLTTEVIVHQPDFGLRPYRAMLGALRVRADVIVRASVPWSGP